MAVSLPPTFEPTDHPHRRFNPLTGKHVLVSPHRTKRPWNGQTEEPVKNSLPAYDEKCYLCPRNQRMGGQVNPPYKDTYLFPNDFPALLPDPLPALPPLSPTPTDTPSSIDSLFASEPVRGRCSVVCFHPRHDLTLARMGHEEIVAVVAKWREIYLAEAKFLRETAAPGQEEAGYVQIFENRGAMMGASAPHPHGQVWTLSYVPDEPAVELENLEKYARRVGGAKKAQANGTAAPNGTSAANGHAHAANGCCSNGNGHAETPELAAAAAAGLYDAAAPCRGDGTPCLLCGYAAAEVARQERVVAQDGGWVAVVPFWAVWPYEVMVLPYKRHIPSLAQMTPDEDASLAKVIKAVLVRYDNMFNCPFPYSMGLHQSPLPPTDPDTNAAHTHLHFYPPLLRSASVRKFLVGFEMLGETQRDLTAEQAAAKMRAVDEIHYLEKDSE